MTPTLRTPAKSQDAHYRWLGKRQRAQNHGLSNDAMHDTPSGPPVCLLLQYQGRVQVQVDGSPFPPALEVFLES